MGKTTREASRHSGISLRVLLHRAWSSWFQLLPQQHHNHRVWAAPECPSSSRAGHTNLCQGSLGWSQLWNPQSCGTSWPLFDLFLTPPSSYPWSGCPSAAVSSVPISWKETGLDLSASNDKLIQVTTLAKLCWCLHKLLEAFQEMLMSWHPKLTSASVQSISFSLWCGERKINFFLFSALFLLPKLGRYWCHLWDT